MEKELWVAGTGLIGNKVSALAENRQERIRRPNG